MKKQMMHYPVLNLAFTLSRGLVIALLLPFQFALIGPLVIDAVFHLLPPPTPILHAVVTLGVVVVSLFFHRVGYGIYEKDWPYHRRHEERGSKRGVGIYERGR